MEYVQNIMEKKIYLPPYAKEQLESDNPYEPIPFRDKPSRGFTSEVVLREGTLEVDVDYILEDGFYYPDRDQDLENTLKSISPTPEPKTQEYDFKWRLQTRKMFDHWDIRASLGNRARYDFPNSMRESENNWTYFILDPEKNIVVRETEDKRVVPRNKHGLVELTQEAYDAGLYGLDDLASDASFKKIRKKSQ